MNKLKINTVVDVFCDNLNIQGNFRLALKEMMINIILKYETAGIKDIKDDQEYILKSKDNLYSVEDFFLNRLLFNVTKFEETFNGNRAFYDSYTRSVTFNRNKLLNMFKNSSSISDISKFNAIKKVVMHEFGHSLETQFEKGPKNIYVSQDIKVYQQLYERLKEKGFENQLNELYDVNKHNIMEEKKYSSGALISTGLHLNSDIYKNYRGTFYLNKDSEKYYDEDNMNEIFNESEALEMAKINKQIFCAFPSSNIVSIRNSESSNDIITNIADMMKILLGNRIVFEGMYLNRNVIINSFNNEYGDIIDRAFREHLERKYPNINFKDSWSLLTAVVNEIKYSYENNNIEYSEICLLKMNLVLSECFNKKIVNEINKGASIDECRQEFLNFANYVISNNDNTKRMALPHIQIMYSLKQYILENADKLNVDTSFKISK